MFKYEASFHFINILVSRISITVENYNIMKFIIFIFY